MTQMPKPRRIAAACLTSLALAAVVAPSALAFDCGNASKPVGHGEKAVFGADGPISISKSWQNQLDHGKTPDSIHGGFVGIDCNGDGVADVETYADPHGEIPQSAQQNGSPDHGIVPIESSAPATCLQ